MTDSTRGNAGTTGTSHDRSTRDSRDKVATGRHGKLGGGVDGRTGNELADASDGESDVLVDVPRGLENAQGSTRDGRDRAAIDSDGLEQMPGASRRIGERLSRRAHVRRDFPVDSH